MGATAAFSLDSPLFLVDVARLLAVLVGMPLAVYQVSLIRKARTPGQRARLGFSLIALATLAGDRIAYFGEPPSWGLLATLTAIALSAYGSWDFHGEPNDRPARTRPHPRAPRPRKL